MYVVDYLEFYTCNILGDFLSAFAFLLATMTSTTTGGAVLTPIEIESQISSPGTIQAPLTESRFLEVDKKPRSVIPEGGDEVNPKESNEITVALEEQYMTGFKLVSIVISLLLAVFCVALDNTSQFHIFPKINCSIY
jgi:hypothetical protein